MRQRVPLAASLLFALSAISLLFAACGGKSSDTSSSARPQTIEISTSWASGNASTVPSLVGTSDVVFVGTVARLVEVRQDTIFPGSDGDAVAGKPVRPPTTFPFSVYEVQVTSSVKGGLVPGSPVTYEQAGGLTEQNGAAVRLQLMGDDPIEAGRTYLFFASYKQNGALAAPPYGRLQVSADGRLQPLSHWAHLGALHQLAGLTAGQADQTLRDAG